MTATRIAREEWRTVLDWLSRSLEGRRAEIEVQSLAIGAQTQGKWLTALGLVYDDKDDLIEIALDGLDHMIHNPREVTIEDDVRGVVAIQIVDADDVRQVLRFREPLALAPP